MRKFTNDIYVKEVIQDIYLHNKCQETFKMIQETKPERISNGIETWFREEESKQ